MSEDYLTLNKLINEMYPFHNDIVIVSDQLARLIGVGNDGSDFYYICQHMRRKTCWHSCVGACESIKGKIGDHHYLSIDSTFELNGAPKTEKFYVESDHSIAERDSIWMKEILTDEERKNLTPEQKLLCEIFGKE
jgi:hypothetical protein